MNRADRTRIAFAGCCTAGIEADLEVLPRPMRSLHRPLIPNLVVRGVLTHNAPAMHPLTPDLDVPTDAEVRAFEVAWVNTAAAIAFPRSNHVHPILFVCASYGYELW